MLIALILTSFNTYSQKITYKNLIDGVWKRDNLPDSVFLPGESVKEPAINVLIRFIDGNKADVSYNGFYIKSQSFQIDTSNNLIYVTIIPNLENVGNLQWIIKYIDANTIKVQMNAQYKIRVPWATETWYNTNVLTFYKNS